MGGACSTYREKSGANMALVGKPEGKRPFGRPRLRWEANIKLDFQEVGWGAVALITVVQIGTGCCECGIEPSGSIKCWEFLD